MITYFIRNNNRFRGCVSVNACFLKIILLQVFKLSFYSDNALFSDINSDPDKSISKTEEKAFLQKFLNYFNIKSIEMIGYSDYLEYEIGDGREVLLWSKYNLVQKKDKKAIVLPIHLSDSFDDKRKIVAEMAYYSKALLTR